MRHTQTVWGTFFLRRHLFMVHDHFQQTNNVLLTRCFIFFYISFIVFARSHYLAAVHKLLLFYAHNTFSINHRKTLIKQHTHETFSTFSDQIYQRYFFLLFYLSFFIIEFMCIYWMSNANRSANSRSHVLNEFS